MERTRRGAGSVLLGASLALGCAELPPAHNPRPAEPKQSPKAAVLFTPPEDGPCGRFSSFDPGEKVVRVIHGQDVDYTLTDRTLYIWRLVGETRSSDGQEVTVRHQCSRSDVRAIIQRGILLWHLEGDTCYFFTKTRELIALPHGDLGQMLTYKVDFDTSNLNEKRIAFFGGMIFIAPISDQVIVISLEPKIDVAPIDVYARDPKAAFIQANGRLYFGVQSGLMFELYISGKTASSVNALELR
jgi:hypothetical protein